MKLTVGRIVHAHYMVQGINKERESAPHAAIVTCVEEGVVLLRLFDPVGANFDRTVKVEMAEERGSLEWYWRWPPREN